MAVNTMRAEASPDAVFEVLADPDCYGKWVVGSSQIRDVEGPWPAAGSTFHHTQGVGPLGIKDTTTVLESEPGRRIVLEVRARPMVVARVELELRAVGNETEVTMTEVPVDGPVSRLPALAIDPPLKLRNAESLRRLRRLAERT
jgi:uncharacterized protein YndB with AHSA1/START domain